ncbi:hypothetical protein ACIQMP_07980 [Streptomyces sp. NPDC091385]|uniref:hypothetical protein n=1 Tax=Streptomyces sp. NPDC091385 TaxID=3365997 RepID=UPI0038217B68
MPTGIADAVAAGIRRAEELRTARTDAARWKDRAVTTAAERDAAYKERAHLLAWLAALHPASAVITPASDITDEPGWHLLYLVAGGWQMSWPIRPRDRHLFGHVTVVDPADLRAQWDGHGTDQKYARIRQHTRLLAGLLATGDLQSGLPVGDAIDRVDAVESHAAQLRARALHDVWVALRAAPDGPHLAAMTVVNRLMERAGEDLAEAETRSV